MSLTELAVLCGATSMMLLLTCLLWTACWLTSASQLLLTHAGLSKAAHHRHICDQRE
jgi:hypothetical protein